ncbi:hypothetical protein ACLHDD_12880 [Pantoea sp. NSTU24]|uniref:hypothetical protein n=1 Tax=Pantoea sp. NSTU24 TaxID=3391144 RepID=UPI003CFEE5A6
MKQRFFLSLLLVTGGLMTALTAHAACTIQLSEPQIDYGEMTRGELLSRPGNILSAAELRIGDEREIGLSVICDRPTPMALTFSGPAKDNESYLFGEQGRATLTLHDVTLDDQPVMIDSAGGQAAKMAFTDNHPMRFLKAGQRAAGTTLRANVTVVTWLSSPATRVSEQQQWQLNGRFLVSSEG